MTSLYTFTYIFRNGCTKTNSLQEIQEEYKEQAPLASRRSLVNKYLLSIREPVGKVWQPCAINDTVNLTVSIPFLLSAAIRGFSLAI